MPLKLIRSRVVRKTQPQDTFAVDWSNKLTRGLKFLSLPGVAGGITPFGAFATTGIASQPTRFGTAAKFSPSSAFNVGRLIGDSRQTILFGYFAPPSPGSFDYLLGSKYDGNYETTSLNHSSSGGLLTLGTYSSGSGGQNVVVPRPETGTYNTVFAKLGQANIVDTYTIGYVGESGLITQASNNYSSSALRSNHDHYIGSGADNSGPWRYTAAPVLWVGVWEGHLTDQDLRQISENPWQLFAPSATQRTLWLPEAAGGTPATGVVSTLTAIASAVGSVQGTGAASRATTGLAAALSLGSVAVTASARVSPVGLQSVVSVGTPTATGGTTIPATVSPSGQALALSRGTAVVTGAARPTPVGLVTTFSVGNPTATGGSVIPATVQPTGTGLSTSVTAPIVSGASNRSLTGLSTGFSLGVTTRTAAANVALNGVSLSTLLGLAVATGGAVVPATVTPTGIILSTSLGNATRQAASNVAASSQPLAFFIGSSTVTAGARVAPTGRTAAISVGQPLGIGSGGGDTGGNSYRTALLLMLLG